MPLPPEMNRQIGLDNLMNNAYTLVPNEIKERINRINEMYIEIAQTYELPPESHTTELINIMLSRTRNMLNYILDNIYRTRLFRNKKELIEQLGSAIGEIFVKFNNSTVKVIKKYGPKLYNEYKRLFDLDYLLGIEDFYRDLMLIEDVPVNVIPTKARGNAFEAALRRASRAEGESSSLSSSSSSSSS